MASRSRIWDGDYWFAVASLVEKDFKVRYRNMWLGAVWSLVSPLVMMTVLTFVSTQIFTSNGLMERALSILCGLVPFNFFSIGWSTGTTSVLMNSSLLKRVPVPRQIFPVASVLANCVHLVIQIGLLLAGVLIFGRGLNIFWLWLPLICILEVLFVLGLVLIFSAVNVYVRDTRYVVESASTIMFWLVPVFYSFTLIPPQYRTIYEFNPVAALVMMLRTILMDGRAPVHFTLAAMFLVSTVTFAAGCLVFRKLQSGFYEYL